MALAPEAGESWVAKGAYHYRVLRDFEGAVTAYQEAQRRLPNNTFLLQNLAFVLRRVGRWQDAETNYNKALELDPRDVSLLSSLGGEFYGYLRRFDDAHAVVDRALEISPIRRRHMRSKPPFCKTKGDSLKRLRSWRASLRARQKIMSLLVGSRRRRMNAASIALFV
jgi:tetratricopeptide (TPR) repeat protein